MKKRKIFHVLLLALFAAVVSGCSPEPVQKPQFSAIDITGAPYANDFALTDQHGQARSIKDFTGKAVLLFFGFTQCPDVCPTTLAEAVQIKQRLAEDGSKFQVLFVTLDPERDTPEVLKAYVNNFDPTFLALRTTPDKLQDLAKDFKVYYKKVDGKTPASYTLDHSAGSFVYDPQGRVRLYSRYGSGAAAMAADIDLLLKPV
ncbi:MAG: SCO family protein [Burkholderiaceae bacterium]